jgi:RNA polymerase sigma-70 factor (ECF subfamily)
MLRATSLAPVPAGASDEPDELAVAAERREALLAAVRRLPEKDQLVITYRYFLDLSEAETATALGWPRGSVKSRLSRALRRLQEPVAAALGGATDG